MRVNEDGSVTIPEEIREALGLKPGTEVEVIAEGDGVRVERSDAKEARRVRLEEGLRHLQALAKDDAQPDEAQELTPGQQRVAEMLAIADELRARGLIDTSMTTEDIMQLTRGE